MPIIVDNNYENDVAINNQNANDHYVCWELLMVLHILMIIVMIDYQFTYVSKQRLETRIWYL